MYRLTPQAKQGWHKSGWVRSDFVVDWDFVLRDVQNRNWLTFQMDFSLVIIQNPEKRVEMVLRGWTLEFHEVKFLRIFRNSINWLESSGFLDEFLPFPKVRKLKVCCVSIPEAGHLVPTVQVGCGWSNVDPRLSFFLFSDGDFSSKPWGTWRDPN